MNTHATLKHAIDIAMQTGNLLLEYFENPLEETTKSTDTDIVTQADQAAEKFIMQALLAHFPDHHLVGEEGGGSGAPRDKANYLWFVDPIDGTSNFANKIPHYCTSIALTNAEQEPLLGVIYDPNRDELFTAVKGTGAHLNGHTINVTPKEDLLQCILASGFPYDKHSNADNNLKEWGNIAVKVRGVRRLGSAALDFAYVAAGRLDGYWERSLNMWDVAAGILLVREAGGTVTDYTGDFKPQTKADGRYVASNGHIHPAMLALLQNA